MYIYIYKYVHEHTPLAKPSFCSGGRISCKPNNGALRSTSINRNDDNKSPNYCAPLGTSANSNNDSKSIGGCRYGFTSKIASDNNRNVHSTINYKCEDESSKCTNQKK